ncbi:MAG: DUF2190 family protein [Magnetococcales bacterium]|nr:DUF2190 family protein [Magnetococcales bacterium]
MKNWIQQGNSVPMVSPVAVSSGDGVLIGDLFGVASSAAAIGETVQLFVTGVVDLPKAAVSITQGAKVYWDDTAKNVTTTSAGNTLIGCAIVAAAVGDAIVQIRLNGAVA